MEKIDKLKSEIQEFKASSLDQIEEFRVKFISRKSIIGELFGKMKGLADEERKVVGQHINELKNQAQSKFQELVATIDQEKKTNLPIDLTLPTKFASLGSSHPITIIRNEIINIFSKLGFNIAQGPEIEDDWHNFTALNFPANHPAREMQDTFFIEKNPDIALRTHTSSVQIRVMENEKPPIRTLSLGRVFRNEAISARSHCIFHQAEGLYINKNVSFVDLKQTLYYFVKEMFGSDVKIRFRPSYFPFTEPSAEVDISCNICGGSGCNICKYTGWVEIAGAGMVDSNVLINTNIDQKKYTGFAFGMGLERMAMLKWQIKDLRLFTENDIRFLEQFKSL